jgi:proline iminopeptidase
LTQIQNTTLNKSQNTSQNRNQNQTARTLYPPFPLASETFLKVSPLHTLRVEASGNPKGKPVIFLHGGPGGGMDTWHRQFFNPEKWHIIGFDQRGCGKSTPHAELRENTTWDLVADIETIRKHFGIKSWTVFGGSWGSTLALAYAQTHPNCVSEMILRGIFMLRKEEIDWFYQEGTSKIYPDQWEEYLKPIPENERHDLVAAYWKRLTSDNRQVRAEAAKAWSMWEGMTSCLFVDPSMKDRFGQDEFADAFARIECHYFTNKGFLNCDDHLLKEVHKIRHIPCTIVHGRYDVVCPVKNAWDLHRAWPEANLKIVADAGHAAKEPGILTELINATDALVSSASSSNE